MLRVINKPDEFRKNVVGRLEARSLDHDVCENLEKGILPMEPFVIIF